MCTIPKRELHAKIMAAAGHDVEDHGPFDEVPYRLRIAKLGDYAFTLTSPTGGRPLGEYKIQLILPKQPRGARGSLSFLPEVVTVLLGWSEEDVFATWDAYAHESFSYSQNLQIKGESVWMALAGGLGTAERNLRGGRGGIETTVVCRRDHFLRGVDTRVRISATRLSGAEVGP